MRKPKKTLSTTEKGTQFEKEVLDVLRLLPYSSLQEHVSIGGKDIDAICEITDVLGSTSFIGFEAKDYERPLTREYVATILAEYQPLLSQRLIDKFILITRNGIVANAKKCFDNKDTQHLLYSELLDRLLSPAPLIGDMQKQFTIDDLDKYYVETNCHKLDISFVSSNFHLVYNPFIDFAVEEGIGFHKAVGLWERLAPDVRTAGLSNKYHEGLFNQVILARRGGDVVQLEPLISAWVEAEEISQAIAILGSYGTGKSSFAKKLAYDWARRYERGDTNRIPLLIELREFGFHQDIRGLITHELVNRHGVKYGSFECFNLLNQQGKFLLILDGFDEMKQGLSKDVLVFNFNELNKLYTSKSKIVLCGRPTVFASEGEQSSILSGSTETHFTHSVEYIQLNIAPFSTTDIFRFLKDYTNVKYKKNKETISDVIDELKDELPTNSDLAMLLSRPVHLPMLVAVLPDWTSEIRNLSRGKLYALFIDKTITREMLKKRSELTDTYDVATRRRFSSDLAVQMFKLGDSRSIRFSEIPDELIKPFKSLGQTLESVKRDLIAACFLERKPPDILFFGHKSFAEYLVADNVISLIREGKPSTDRLGIKFSPEIVSFISEIASMADWTAVAKSPASNTRLLDSTFRFLIRRVDPELPANIRYLGQALRDPNVFEAWGNEYTKIPLMLLFHFTEYLEGALTERICGTECQSFLKLLIKRTDDMVAVHAYRALNKIELMTQTELLREIGVAKYEKWKKLGWLVNAA